MELYLYRNGEQVGPYSEAQISLWVSRGDLSQDDIIWHESLSEWQPIHSVVRVGPVNLPASPAVSESHGNPDSKDLDSPKNWAKSIKVVGLSLVLVLVGFYFASPYLNLYHMKGAVDDLDAIKLADHVDFPSLRESLKATLKANLLKQAANPENDGFAAIGAAFGTMMIGPMIDSMVTPEGLISMLQGDDLFEAEAPSTFENEFPTSEKKEEIEGENNPSTKLRVAGMNYEKLDRFVVSATNDIMVSKGEEPLTLVFGRKGLFSWKLTGIRMSLD